MRHIRATAMALALTGAVPALAQEAQVNSLQGGIGAVQQGGGGFRGGPRFGWRSGGFLAYAPGGWVRSRDDGFFFEARRRSGRYRSHGGYVDVVNGEASYDYDRDYPYDYRSQGYDDRGREDFEGDTVTGPGRCRTEWVPGGSGRAQVPVRICSGAS